MQQKAGQYTHLRNALDDHQQLLGSQVRAVGIQQPLAQHGQDQVQDGGVGGACPHRLPCDEHNQRGQEVLAVVRGQSECRGHRHCMAGNMEASMTPDQIVRQAGAQTGSKAGISNSPLAAYLPFSACHMNQEPDPCVACEGCSLQLGDIQAAR